MTAPGRNTPNYGQDQAGKLLSFVNIPSRSVIMLALKRDIVYRKQAVWQEYLNRSGVMELWPFCQSLHHAQIVILEIPQCIPMVTIIAFLDLGQDILFLERR